ncbi:MAG: NADH-quinone oxidoreductase subunit H [Bacteroidota bacterium]
MLSVVIIFISSLFFLGILNKTKAILAGRKGAGLLQPIYDILRLLRKGSVFSTQTSFVFQIAPSIYLASILLAACFIPFGDMPGLFSFPGDFIFFAYLLGFGKLFALWGAMDVGSSFEGMGANREALYSMLAEPAFFVVIGSFGVLANHTSFHEIFSNMHFGSPMTYLLGVLAAYVMVQVAMIENSRLPVNDPKTHLELTMIHEVMVLDNSGFDLGMIFYGSALKFSMYGMLITGFVLAPSLPIWAKIIIAFAIQFAFAVTAGILESFRARARMKRNPQIVFMLTTIGVLLFLGALVIRNKLSI